MFFSLVFPLMFLVLFGGIFSDQTQSEIDMIQVGDVALFDDLPDGAQDAFDDDLRRRDSRRPRPRRSRRCARATPTSRSR